MTTLSPPARPAYREPAYRRYIGGDAVSALGDAVWYTALSWVAVQLSSPTVAGVVTTISALPRLALLLFGGPLADRFDARRLMMGSDVMRALVMGVAALVALRATGIAMLVAIELVFGVVDAVFLPAAASVQPRLLRPEQLASGSAMWQLGQRVALALGAPLGGVLLGVGGLPLACLANAATFLVSLLAVRSIRPRPLATQPTGQPSYLASLRAGLAYLGRKRALLAVIMVSLLTNLGFVGPMNIGLALLAVDHGWGPSAMGLLLAGFGVAAAAGAATLVRVRLRGRPAFLIAAVCLAEAAGIAGLAIAGSLAVAVAASAVIGVVSSLFATLCGTLAQTLTADEFRGRVSSVTQLVNAGVAPLAISGFAAAAGVFGTTTAYLASSVIVVAAAALCLLPALRRVQPDDARAVNRARWWSVSRG